MADVHRVLGKEPFDLAELEMLLDELVRLVIEEELERFHQ
jgi:hypothetical protein